jgi:hypothetical protein
VFPYLPGQSGYGKRLRRHGGLLATVITELARDTGSWHDLLRLVDSTPLPCAATRRPPGYFARSSRLGSSTNAASTWTGHPNWSANLATLRLVGRCRRGR